MLSGRVWAQDAFWRRHTQDVTWNKEAGEEDHEEHEALNIILAFSSFLVVFRQFRNYLTSRYESPKPLPDSTG